MLRQDPYLWIHLSGLATLPLWVAVCIAGLATADPVLPVWLEMALLTVVGILPVLWMQWQRPFYIFSLGFLSLTPAALTETQRQFLTLFRTWPVRLLVLAGAVGLAPLLWQIYRLAPVAATSTPFVGANRLLGLTIAALAFLAMNLFVQVPLSVLRILLAKPATVAEAVPYPVGAIARDFSLIGLQSRHLLPELRTAEERAIAPSLDASSDETPARVDTAASAALDQPAAAPDLSTAYESHDLADPWGNA